MLAFGLLCWEFIPDLEDCPLFNYKRKGFRLATLWQRLGEVGVDRIVRLVSSAFGSLSERTLLGAKTSVPEVRKIY